MTTEIVKRVKLPNKGSYKFGCDPELFLMKGDKVIGSERVVPEKGLLPSFTSRYGYARNSAPVSSTEAGVTQDGVQAELHILPINCRANFSNNLYKCIASLKEEATKKGATLSLNPVVTVSNTELEGLSDKSKEVGCAPSSSIYNDPPPVVDGIVYRRRSAGGHIHLSWQKEYLSEHDATCQDIVAMLDVFVGNTSVLLDRARMAKERRKFYGRAGEYRTKSYGLEYRTLSNFWLHSPHLVTLLLGLADTAVTIVVGNKLSASLLKKAMANERREYGYNDDAYLKRAYTQADPDPFKWVMERVDLERIRKAINTNDYRLALSNFHNIVQPFLLQFQSNLQPNLNAENLSHLYYLSYRIKEEGIAKVFDVEDGEDWLAHWKRDAHETGWGDWCRYEERTLGYKTFMAAKGASLGFILDKQYWGAWVPKGLNQDPAV